MSDSESIDCELPDFELEAGEIGRGFIPVIRMGHIQTNESVSYASFQPSVGTICPITPVGSKIKKAVFSGPVLLSPNSGAPLAVSKIEAVTPQGKNKLVPDLVIGSMFTPKGNTEHQIVRLRGRDDDMTISEIKSSLKMEEFKRQFKLDSEHKKSSQESSEDSSSEAEYSLPEFRGGWIVLTADDVKYRSSKNKSTGGHRSLFAKPGQVMNYQSAKEAADELGLLDDTFPRWDWGHLFPAGGTPKGVEANLDPLNFVAVPATLNTWQMVPEMMARHLAKLGFEVEYAAIARTEFNTETEQYSFVAKEIYSSVKLRHHGLKAEFFTSRDGHAKPLITDAVHMLGSFYKVAGKPVPSNLKEIFEAEYKAEIDKRGILVIDLTESPSIPKEKKEKVKPVVYLHEHPMGLTFSPIFSSLESRNKFNKENQKPVPLCFLEKGKPAKKDKDKDKHKAEEPKTPKREIVKCYDVEDKEESIAKRVKSRERYKSQRK